MPPKSLRERRDGNKLCFAVRWNWAMCPPLFCRSRGVSLRFTSRLIGFFCGAAFCALPATSVLGDSLQLTGAGPAGTVYLYGSALPSPYTDAAHQVDAYAGVLDWKDTTNNTTVYTYCIDVAAIIYTGQTYNFNSPVDLGSASLPFTTQQINGIYNLWTDTHFGLANGVNGPVTSASQQDAAMFQVAIWDILYNDGSTSLTNSALSFANPSDGLDSTSLQNALTYANQDYNAPAPSGNPGVFALVATDGSQNQALYIGGTLPPATTVPLPASSSAGLALLGICGIAGAGRFRANRIKSAL